MKCKIAKKDNVDSSLGPDGFVFDTDGDDVICEEVEEISSYGSVPKYETEYYGILQKKEFSMETGAEVNDARPRKTCFNCLGDHSIGECPEEKDLKQIIINKKNILGKRSNNRSSVRYHKDMENSQIDVRPGQVSPNLRKALGIGDNELPVIFYRMRYLGYPPGWLKNAEVQRAKVLLFDGDGLELAHPDFEEGESESSFVKYEPDKLIEYPGFNVKLPSHIRDQTRDHNMPRMSARQSKAEFKKYMMLNKATKYKKKKLKISDTPTSDTPTRKGHLLDLSTNSDNDSSDTNEMSKDVNGSMADISNVCSTRDEVNASQLSQSTDDQNSNDGDSTLDTSTRQFQSKGFEMGIHIPPSITEHRTLPSFDKWTVDISDHIDFENLPDALGMWHKMKGIVGSVKTLMEKIQKDHERESDSD